MVSWLTTLFPENESIITTKLLTEMQKDLIYETWAYKIRFIKNILSLRRKQNYIWKGGQSGWQLGFVQSPPELRKNFIAHKWHVHFP